nr:PREDICTED: uncharacterized protein LOC109037447 [Bemisia tabaci]XP_018907667.1 PREDICTED: uncharacterized protein LOC109037447 [Bemisia tabaci]
MADIPSVFITGASRGLGLEFVKQFLSSPLVKTQVVIAACRSPDKANALQDLKKNDSRLHIVQLDVCQFDSYDPVVNEVRAIVGDKGLTLLINNAGILHRVRNLEEVTADLMLSVLKTNTVAPLLLTKAFLPLLKTSAKVNAAKVNNALSVTRAAVISINSGLGSIEDNGMGGYYGYRESKVALNMSAQSLSIELGPDGILVESIYPGWVQTDMGGSNAAIDATTSVNGMIKIMLDMKEKNKTGFIGWQGKVLPF